MSTNMVFGPMEVGEVQVRAGMEKRDPDQRSLELEGMGLRVHRGLQQKK